MTTTTYEDIRREQASRPSPLTANQRIVQAANHFTRLRGVPETQRDLYRRYGIHTHEPWCVNFVSAVCATAGLRPPIGAHVDHIPPVSSRVISQNIQPGDIAMNSRHTGIVLNVHRDPSGRPIAYDFLNGNTIENGVWTVGVQRINLSSNPCQFFRHNGEPSRVAPPAIFASNHGIMASGTITSGVLAAGGVPTGG